MNRLTLVAAALLCAAGSACAQDDDMPSLDEIPHITIVGTAHAEVRPDLATITLGVTSEEPTAAAAAEDNASKAQAVIDAAKAAGVPAVDIASQSVTLTQTFDPVKDEHGNEIGRKPRGFAAENIIAIKVRDLAKAGAIAQALIGKGANRFDGVEFAVEHPEPVLDKLTGQAVKNARTQAEIAAEAAGVRIGRVLLIERPGEPQAPHVMMRRKVAAAAESPVPLEGGTTSFSSSVEVTWAIDQK